MEWIYLECPTFDTPPLTYNIDENKEESLWIKVAQVVLHEHRQNTLKYIRSYKTMHQLYQESGFMPFHFINDFSEGRQQPSFNFGKVGTSGLTCCRNSYPRRTRKEIQVGVFWAFNCLKKTTWKTKNDDKRSYFSLVSYFWLCWPINLVIDLPGLTGRLWLIGKLFVFA
jgi:hypothetical protein